MEGLRGCAFNEVWSVRQNLKLAKCTPVGEAELAAKGIFPQIEPRQRVRVSQNGIHADVWLPRDGRLIGTIQYGPKALTHCVPDIRRCEVHGSACRTNLAAFIFGKLNQGGIPCEQVYGFDFFKRM